MIAETSFEQMTDPAGRVVVYRMVIPATATSHNRALVNLRATLRSIAPEILGLISLGSQDRSGDRQDLKLLFWGAEATADDCLKFVAIKGALERSVVRAGSI